MHSLTKTNPRHSRSAAIACSLNVIIGLLMFAVLAGRLPAQSLGPADKISPATAAIQNRPATLPQEPQVVLSQVGGGLNRQAFLPLQLDRISDRASRGRLASDDSIQVGLVLEAMGRGPARMAEPAARSGQYWSVLPVELGIVRIQRFARGSLWSLEATGPAGAAVLAPTARDANQLWRVVSYGDTARLDSVAYPGRSLAGSADGLVTIERTSGAAAQRWFVDFGPPPPTIVLPSLRLASHEVIPNPDLPPAIVTLLNSHDSDLQMLIGDLRPGQTSRQLSLPAGGSVRVRFARDAGATIREIYEIRTPSGVVSREEYVTAIPPITLYDISVYERFLQSIAIDRTGKSPQTIEDINYQPKSVGIFPVPAGEHLRQNATIDVWEQAKAARNPGGVRPLERNDPSEKGIGPLERLLEEVSPP